MNELLELAQQIKEKRQELGISREQLSEQTRVPLPFIIALEEERHDELPDLVYSNGFVRIVSKHLGIEPPTLATTNINLQTKMATDLFHARKRKRLILPTKKHTFRLISASLLLLPIAASVVILVLGGKSWFVATPEQTPAATTLANPTNTTDTPDIADLVDMSKPKETVNTQAEIVAPATEQQVQLNVHFPTEVQVKIDGDQRAKEILLPRVHIFKFKDESEFILSDTSAISVSFNGETISNLERLGKRRTLVFRSTASEHANY